MKNQLTLALLAISFLAAGQVDLQRRFPFMHLEANVIEVYGDDDKLVDFYEKLNDLAFEGKGEINVVHMGGSHVQAGMLSQAMREGMQGMSPGLKGSRGFFFPFKLAHTNEPRNFSITSNVDWEGFRCSVNNHTAEWGMSGIVATTTDSNARVSIMAFDGDTGRYSFRSIRIYHPAGKQYYSPVVKSSKYNVDTSYYDERGFTQFDFKEAYDEFEFALKSGDSATSFVWQGVEYVNSAPGIRYHAIGVNGASTKSYLRCDDFATQIPALNPDLVVFGIGINDAYMSEDRFVPAEFKARYDSIMDVFEAANPDVLFLFLTNNDSYYRRRFPNPNAVAVRDVMKELCKERDAIYWDLFEVMGGLGSIDKWVEQGLAKSDRIHLSRDGYELQAKLLVMALEQSWLNYLADID